MKLLAKLGKGYYSSELIIRFTGEKAALYLCYEEQAEQARAG